MVCSLEEAVPVGTSFESTDDHDDVDNDKSDDNGHQDRDRDVRAEPSTFSSSSSCSNSDALSASSPVPISLTTNKTSTTTAAMDTMTTKPTTTGTTMTSVFDAISADPTIPLQSILAILGSSDCDTDNRAHSYQDPATGCSPLMAASRVGRADICRALLDRGAPWNAVDRCGKCAGDYAVESECWDVVNLLVDAGTVAELILGASERRCITMMEKGRGTSLRPSFDCVDKGGGGGGASESALASSSSMSPPTSPQSRPLEHEPCTKPTYLTHSSVHYATTTTSTTTTTSIGDGDNDKTKTTTTAILDDDGDAIMMEWERPLMQAHASVITSDRKGQTVLNVGFGLGIIDTYLQEEWEPALHVIIEAHPAIYDRMVKDGWDSKPNVRLCFGRWQDVLPRLIEEMETDADADADADTDKNKACVDMMEQDEEEKDGGEKAARITMTTAANDGTDGANVEPSANLQQSQRRPQPRLRLRPFDGIFYDTYGEHFTDLEDFHSLLPRLLSKPNGIYSFFNGLAPDNLFFHGVACNCVKLQLSRLGLDAQYASCELRGVVDVNDDSVWDGIRRKYWHGRDTYYLPIVTWANNDSKEKEKDEAEEDGRDGVGDDKGIKRGEEEGVGVRGDGVEGAEGINGGDDDVGDSGDKHEGKKWTTMDSALITTTTTTTTTDQR